MTRSWRGLLFDKDGTLFDYASTWPPVNRLAALAAAGGDEELMARLLERGGQDARTGAVTPGSVLAAGTAREIAEVWAPEIGHADPESLTALIDQVFRIEAMRHAVPVAALDRLFAGFRRRGLLLGVATSDGEAATREQLQAFGVVESLHFVCGYDSGFGSKPGPGMVQGFCDFLSLAPEEVVVIGDSLHDIRMARAAGAGLAVGVLTGTSPREILAAEADLILDSILDLERALGL